MLREKSLYWIDAVKRTHKTTKVQQSDTFLISRNFALELAVNFSTLRVANVGIGALFQTGTLEIL